MDTVFSQLSRGPVRIENGVFIADEKPVGILRPSIIEGKNAGNDMCVISGPAGMACFEPECLQDLVEGLISTEALLFGHPDNVSACAELYD